MVTDLRAGRAAVVQLGGAMKPIDNEQPVAIRPDLLLLAPTSGAGARLPCERLGDRRSGQAADRCLSECSCVDGRHPSSITPSEAVRTRMRHVRNIINDEGNKPELLPRNIEQAADPRVRVPDGDW